MTLLDAKGLLDYTGWHSSEESGGCCWYLNIYIFFLLK